MAGFAPYGVAAEQRQHTDAQLKTGVNKGGEGDNGERMNHGIFILVYLCLIYSISGEKALEKGDFYH